MSVTKYFMIQELRHIDMEGAILHFKDGTRGLIEASQQPITSKWVEGDKVKFTVAETPIFQLRCLDTNEIAHALVYDGEEPLSELPN